MRRLARINREGLSNLPDSVEMEDREGEEADSTVKVDN